MEKGRIRREGIEVGLLGATAVAIWFFFVDLLAGHPFYTPYSLGSVLQGFFGASEPASMPLTILLYTIVHYLAFIVFGIVVAAIFNAAEREPAVFFGFFILFVGLEILWLGVTLIVEETSALRNIAWYQIAAANLVAAITMGTYLFRRHRGVIRKVGHSLRGM